MAPSRHISQQSRPISLNKGKTMSLTHYEMLQVAPRESAIVIKNAYHAAARKHHPDKRRLLGCDYDEAAFLRIQAAWECLRCPKTRSQYDLELHMEQASKNTRRRNAVPILPHDCREVDVTHGEYDLTFQCRCGSDLHVSQLRAVEDSVEMNGLVHCPGCSLIYDITELTMDEDEDEELL